MIEVEVQPDRRGRRDDALAVESDELPFRKELDVLAIVTRLEALLVGQRREDDRLQVFELVGVFRAG